MEKLLHFIAFFGIYSLLLIGVAAWLRKSVTARWIFSGAWGLYLTVQVVFFHGLLPLRFGEQLSSIEWGSDFIEWVHGSRTKAMHFADNGCTLIDVAFDQVLVTAPEYHDDSLKRVITDRNKLARLLAHLATHDSLFDVVVLDVYFQDTTSHDGALANALERLAANSKLALAHDPGLCTNTIIYSNGHLANAYGGISEQRIEDLYFQHALIAPPLPGHAARRYSLPYRAYTLLDRVDELDAVNHFVGYAHEHAPNGNGWFTTRYTPMFLMGNKGSDDVGSTINTMLGGEAEAPPEREGAQLEERTGALPMGLVVQEIERDSSTAFFNERLAFRHRNGNRHLVFIGNFNDPDRDLHQTAQGPMQGAMMSVNIIHELLEHQHRNLWLMVFALWLVMARLTFMLVRRCLKDPEERKPHSNPILDLFGRLGRFLFVEESHYWMLFILLLLLQALTHRVLNMMSLVLLFALMEFIFRSWLPVRINATT